MKSSLVFEWPLVVLLGFIVLAIHGCATTSNSEIFDQSEIDLIPTVSFSRILTSSEYIMVKVRAKGINGPAEVQRILGDESVVVRLSSNQEVTISYNEITEIERIVIKDIPMPSSGHQRTKKEEVADTLVLLPFIPLAPVMWPLYIAAGGPDRARRSKIDAVNRWKATLVYGGMSKDELILHVGEPREMYRCEASDWDGASDLWIYGDDQVLPGARSMQIRIDSGRVFDFSRPPSNWKCTIDGK